MERHCEALVLGIGNVLWADERFGVRAVEALHAAYAFPSVVVLKDGGALGLNLYDSVASARRVLVFDAIDVRREPGTLIVLRGAEVPAWGRTRLSPHQPGFNDVLALARLNGRAPETIVAIGAQPRALSDFGGSLTECVRKRLPRRPGARRAGVGAMGLPRQAAARRKPFRAAQRALACARRLRIRTAVCRGGARVLARADARRRAETLTVCVGVSMQVVGADDGVTICAGRAGEFIGRVPPHLRRNER